MKNLGVVILVLTFLVCVSGVVFAADTTLTVYNTSGQAVASTEASATASTPKDAVKAGDNVTIAVSASIPDTLSVKFTNTKINWTVNKAGTYITKGFDIEISGNTDNAKVTFAGCADLKNASNQTLKTYYDSSSGSTIATMPTNWKAAAELNKSADLKQTKYSIWNKIIVPEGTAPGTYSDEFTMTFSQTL